MDWQAINDFLKSDVDELGEDEIDNVTHKIVHREEKNIVAIKQPVYKEFIDDSQFFLYQAPFSIAPSLRVIDLLSSILAVFILY